MNTNTKSKSGFTIIEVVLVLAIAGLIFLIVFLAVPALQRSQRDTQRKSDLGRFMSQISNYKSNNRGNSPAPANIAAFQTTYLNVGGDTFGDPQGSAYTYVTGAGAAPAAGTIRYTMPGRCHAANAGVTVAGTGQQVAASIGLEGGGAYCQQS